MIPTIGFGTYRVKDPNIIHEAVKCGYNHFDTAELYKNEHIIKSVLDQYPERKFYIVTKISKTSLLEPGGITKSFYKRLEIWGHINVLLLHVPTEHCLEDWNELVSLYEQNRDKVDYIGVSNYDIKHLEPILNKTSQSTTTTTTIPYCNQIELSPFYTRNELVEYLTLHKIKIVSHTTLTRTERFNEPLLKVMSERYKISIAKVLLQWAYQNGYVIIPKADLVEHMIENKNLVNNLISTDDLCVLSNLDEKFHLTKITA